MFAGCLIKVFTSVECSDNCLHQLAVLIRKYFCCLLSDKDVYLLSVFSDKECIQ